MRVFRPAARAKWAQVVGIGLTVLVLLTAVGLTTELFGHGPTYTLSHGAVTFDSGSFYSGKRTFAASDVTDARVVALQNGIRTNGTGAPGLCAGHFRYSNLGDVWQANRCEGTGVLVSVRGQDEPLLVSPPDPEGFIAQLRAGTDMVVTTPGAGPSLVMLIPIGALVSVFFVAAVFAFGPRAMRYVIDGSDLRIETLFSKRTYPARELRARLHVPSVSIRLWGTSFPGYHTGLFRESGETTRITATDVRSEGVLVEGPARLFVSPADVRAFLVALEHAGATVRSG